MSERKMGDLDLEVFAARLYEIMLVTSATARGKEVSGAMLGKPRLGLTGAALKARIRANTYEVARVIAQAVAEDWIAVRVIGAVIATTHAGFPPTVSGWRTHQTTLRRDTGQRYGISPNKIPRWVNRFKRTLARTVDGPDPVRRAAWVEWMWDHMGHPLADGCGRTAKGISAWVLTRHGISLPKHPSKAEYNEAMAAGFKVFLAYYRRCSREAAGRRGPMRAAKDPGKSNIRLAS